MTAALLFASCETYDLDKLVDEEYHKVLCLKNVSQDAVIWDLKLDYTWPIDVAVLKSGSRTELEASAKLSLMTQEEVEAYNIKGTLFPPEWFSFDGDIEFAPGQTSRLVTITFKPTDKINQYLRDNLDKTHIVPLILTSDTDKINEYRNIIILTVKLP